MAQLVIQVTDDEKADFLRQLLQRFDFVTQVEIQTQDREAQRKRILSYAGGWADLSSADWEQLQSILQRRETFFPERDLAW